MKSIILSIALLSPAITLANNFNMPWNNNNGSNWNMPSMNWGNNGSNGFGNGTNWNMPSMNWGNNRGNGFGNGTNFSMPSMNWGNNNGGTGFGNGTNWNMPSMNWGNNNGGTGFGNGTNWNMPSMNWGNNNAPRWSGGNVPNYTYMPRAMVQPQMNAPQMPVAPRFIPRQNVKAPVAMSSKQVAPKPSAMGNVQMPDMKKMDGKISAQQKSMSAKIPTPSEVKGVILAPENMPKKPEAPKQQ